MTGCGRVVVSALETGNAEMHGDDPMVEQVVLHALRMLKVFDCSVVDATVS